MALAEQVIDIPLVRGVNDKIDDVMRDQSSVETADNIDYDKIGRAQRRKGTDAPTAVISEYFPIGATASSTYSAATLTSGDQVWVDDPGPVLLDGKAARLATSKVIDRNFLNMGPFAAHNVSYPTGLNALASTPVSFDSVATATYSGYSIYAGGQLGPTGADSAIVFSIVDDSSNTVVLNAVVSTLTGAQVPDPNSVQCVGYNSALWIYCKNAANTQIHWIKIPLPCDGTYTTGDTGLVLGAGSADFSISPVDTIGTGIYLIAKNSAGNWTPRKYTTSPTAPAVTGAVVGSGSGANYIPSNSTVIGNYLILGWEDLTLTSVVAAVWGTAALNVVTGKTVVDFAFGSPVGLIAIGAYETAAAGTQLLYHWEDLQGLQTRGVNHITLAPLTNASSLKGTHLLSNPVFVNGIHYLVLGTVKDADLTNDYGLASAWLTAVSVSVSTPVFYPCGTITQNSIYGTVGGASSFLDGLFSLVAGANGLYKFFYHKGQPTYSVVGIVETPPSYAECAEFRLSVTDASYRGTYGGFLQYNDLLIANNSMLMATDRVDFFELGFTQTPRGPDTGSQVTYTTGGSLTIGGTYAFALVFEWVDRFGRLHRSEPSFVAVTTASDTKAVIAQVIYNTTTGARSFTRRFRQSVKLAVFATENGGDVFYRQFDTPALGPSVSVSAVRTDTPTLYTEGGVLADEPPPPATDVEVFGGRLMVLEAGSNFLWPQNAQVSEDQTDAVIRGFSSVTAFGVGDAQPGTALKAMDQNLIVFKANAIFAIQGSGPNATGLSGGYSDAYKITSDVGCTLKRSVVLTPVGIFFANFTGIYLLTRDLQVQFVGQNVEQITRFFPVIGAILCTQLKRVVFLLDTASPNALVYFYGLPQPVWTTYTFQDGAASYVAGAVNRFDTATISPGDDDLITWVANDGKITQDNRLTYYDLPTETTASTYDTGWLKFDGIDGYQRCRSVVLRYSTSFESTINVTAYKNYEYDDIDGELVPVQSETFTVNGPEEPYRSLPGKEKIHLKHQKVSSIRFVITFGTGGNDADVQLHNLSLTVGVKKGKHKLPASVTT